MGNETSDPRGFHISGQGIRFYHLEVLSFVWHLIVGHEIKLGVAIRILKE